jgi:choline dehydrogenase-like flavoprotein
MSAKVVVIGSGPAGAAAAHELVQNGIPVTMLEAGSDLPNGLLFRSGGKNLFRRVPPLEERLSTLCRAILEPNALSSLRRADFPTTGPGRCRDLHRRIFTEGERLHERFRWPITYSDLVPYYERVEQSLEITADPRLRPRRRMAADCHTQAPSQ